jgi:predicted peptidase
MNASPFLIRTARALALAASCAGLLGGCAVVSVAGAAAGAAISVTGAVVSTGVKVTGTVIEKTVDVVAGGSDTRR